MLTSPDQNVNPPDTIPSNERNEQFRKSLQEILDKPSFQYAVTAHRMFDMHRHSGRLWTRFPDFRPPPGISAQIEAIADRTTFNLDEDQVQELAARMYEGGDYIRSAWLFAAAELGTAGTIFLTAGHSIKNVLPKEEQQSRKYKQMRGMFIRLGKDMNGVYVMQLDGGGSRELYDTEADKEKLLEIITDRLYNSDKVAGSWIRKDDETPKLVICNDNFKIDTVYNIKLPTQGSLNPL